MIAQSDAAVRGSHDGEPLKTILEYAEEQGLSTGVVTNSSVLSATPAACYAHVNDRKNEPDILKHLLNPRFGDGVDAVIGGGREGVIAAAKAAGLAFPGAIRDAGFEMARFARHHLRTATRVVVLLPGDFDLEAGVRRAIDLLSRNPKGFS